MASAKIEESPRVFHPPFNSPEADVILRSAEGTLYRVPSFTLRNTSQMFRDLLLQPRMQYLESGTKEEQPILVPEQDVVLERALRMICGLATPQWESFDEVEDVLTLVEQWGAPGPISSIRAAITAPLFLSEPLRLFVLATRFDWTEEAELASTLTLGLSLYDEEHRDTLYRLRTKDMLQLFSLHRRRRDEFRRFIDSESPFNAGNAAQRACPGCGEETNNHAWRELKARMFLEIDQRPLGAALAGLDMEEWPEAVACWNAKCRKEGCGRVYYNKLATLRDIRDCVDQLPSSI